MESPGTLEPITRQSTASLIADQLREAITTGAFAPGTQMTETGLAEQLGVSRGPLREAMQRLVQEGLLRSELHRGLFVNELDPADVRDVYTVRAIIEQAACTLILRADPDRTADRLEEIVGGMRLAVRGGDAAARGEADLAFHETLVAESGSPRLVRMARTLLVETRMCIAALADKYHLPDDVVDEHSAIVTALRERDETAMRARVETHMMEGLARLVP
jgi:DNA-binding GntR family transcriptional regulator